MEGEDNAGIEEVVGAASARGYEYIGRDHQIITTHTEELVYGVVRV